MSGRIWPGALCVIVRSFAGNEGKVVQCIRLATEGEVLDERFNDGGEPVWQVDRRLSATYGPPVNLARESFLRPITPPPSADTTEDRSPCELESV